MASGSAMRRAHINDIFHPEYLARCVYPVVAHDFGFFDYCCLKCGVALEMIEDGLASPHCPEDDRVTSRIR